MHGTIQPYSDTFAFVIPVDDLLHTPEKPFCYDTTCGCHEDELLISEVAQFVSDGTLSEENATDFVKGKGI